MPTMQQRGVPAVRCCCYCRRVETPPFLPHHLCGACRRVVCVQCARSAAQAVTPSAFPHRQVACPLCAGCEVTDVCGAGVSNIDVLWVVERDRELRSAAAVLAPPSANHHHCLLVLPDQSSSFHWLLLGSIGRVTVALLRAGDDLHRFLPVFDSALESWHPALVLVTSSALGVLNVAVGDVVVPTILLSSDDHRSGIRVTPSVYTPILDRATGVCGRTGALLSCNTAVQAGSRALEYQREAYCTPSESRPACAAMTRFAFDLALAARLHGVSAAAVATVQSILGAPPPSTRADHVAQAKAFRAAAQRCASVISSALSQDHECVRSMLPRRPAVSMPAPLLPAPLLLRQKLLNETRAALLTAQPSQPVVALTGRAGFGKSALAALIARDPDIRARYRGGVFWIGADQDDAPAALAKLQLRVIQASGNSAVAARFSTTATASDRFSLMQRALRGRHVMLIMDDVTSPQLLRALLDAGAAVLLTSRATILMIQHLPSHAKYIEVSELSQEEARQLVSKYTRDDEHLGTITSTYVRIAEGHAPTISMASALLHYAGDSAGKSELRRIIDESMHAPSLPSAFAGVVVSTTVAALHCLNETSSKLSWRLAVLVSATPRPGSLSIGQCANIWRMSSIAETRDTLHRLHRRALVVFTNENHVAPTASVAAEYLSRETTILAMSSLLAAGTRGDIDPDVRVNAGSLLASVLARADPWRFASNETRNLARSSALLVLTDASSPRLVVAAAAQVTCGLLHEWACFATATDARPWRDAITALCHVSRAHRPIRFLAHALFHVAASGRVAALLDKQTTPDRVAAVRLLMRRSSSSPSVPKRGRSPKDSTQPTMPLPAHFLLQLGERGSDANLPVSERWHAWAAVARLLLHLPVLPATLAAAAPLWMAPTLAALHRATRTTDAASNAVRAEAWKAWSQLVDKVPAGAWPRSAWTDLTQHVLALQPLTLDSQHTPALGHALTVLVDLCAAQPELARSVFAPRLHDIWTFLLTNGMFSALYDEDDAMYAVPVRPDASLSMRAASVRLARSLGRLLRGAAVASLLPLVHARLIASDESGGDSGSGDAAWADEEIALILLAETVSACGASLAAPPGTTSTTDVRRSSVDEAGARTIASAAALTMLVLPRLHHGIWAVRAAAVRALGALTVHLPSDGESLRDELAKPLPLLSVLPMWSSLVPAHQATALVAAMTDDPHAIVQSSALFALDWLSSMLSAHGTLTSTITPYVRDLVLVIFRCSLPVRVAAAPPSDALVAAAFRVLNGVVDDYHAGERTLYAAAASELWRLWDHCSIQSQYLAHIVALCGHIAKHGRMEPHFLSQASRRCRELLSTYVLMWRRQAVPLRHEAVVFNAAARTLAHCILASDASPKVLSRPDLLSELTAVAEVARGAAALPALSAVSRLLRRMLQQHRAALMQHAPLAVLQVCRVILERFLAREPDITDALPITGHPADVGTLQDVSSVAASLDPDEAAAAWYGFGEGSRDDVSGLRDTANVSADGQVFLLNAITIITYSWQFLPEEEAVDSMPPVLKRLVAIAQGYSTWRNTSHIKRAAGSVAVALAQIVQQGHDQLIAPHIGQLLHIWCRGIFAARKGKEADLALEGLLSVVQQSVKSDWDDPDSRHGFTAIAVATLASKPLHIAMLRRSLLHVYQLVPRTDWWDTVGDEPARQAIDAVVGEDKNS